MADRINIASLNIDVSELTKSTAKVKEELDSLKKKNKELATESEKNGTGISKAQIENEVTIRQLTKAYNDNMKALLNNAQAVKDLEKVDEILTSTMNEEIATVNEARANIALLTRVRNETNASTEEGAKRIKELNDAIDANNDFIKENGDEMLKLKMNIGNYSDAISEAFDQINIFNGGLIGFISRAHDAGGVGELLNNSFKAMTQGLFGLVKAGIAFIATPIGAVITAIALAVGVVVGAFKFMVNEMSKTEEGSNKLAKVMAIFSGVLNTVTKALKPLAEFIFNTFVSALDTAIAIGEKVIGVYSKVARALGFEGVADGIDNMVKAVKENVKIAQELADAEAKLTEARRRGKTIQLEYQKQAEKLRQQRDDENNSIQKRIELNNQLGVVLKKQLNEEMAIAKQALNVANLRIKAEGKSTENLDERAKALEEIADIQERITGQESEQLANLNSLRKESADKAKEIRDKQLAEALAQSSAQLEALKRELGERAHNAEEQIKLLDKIFEKQKQVANDTYRASQKSASDRLKLQNDLATAEMELLKNRADLAVALADREIEIYRNSIEKQLSDGKIFNQELLNQKLIYLDELANREAEAQRLRFEKGLINEQQYADELLRIDQENLDKRNELIDQNRLAEQNKRLTDIENQKIIDQDNFIAQAQLEKDQNAIKLQQELENAEKTGADVNAIKQKYAVLDKNIDKDLYANKLDIASNAFGNVAKLMGEQTAIGKASAIAQATIDTYKGAVSAYSSLAGIPIVGPALGAVAAGVVIASGLANIKKIASTKTPKAKKGAVIKLGGNSHEMGGNTLYDQSGNPVIEAEKDELIGIMNRNASAHFMGFNDAFSSSGNNTLSTSSGEISTGIKDSTNIGAIGGLIIDAVKSLPAPIVTVEDINYKTAETVKVVSNGDLG